MALRQTHRHSGRHHQATLFAKLAALLVGLAVFSSIALALVGHEAPLNAVPIASPGSSTSNPAVSTGFAAKAAGTGVVTSAAPAVPATTAVQRGSDYFPDHYVNQATEIEEPVATF